MQDKQQIYFDAENFMEEVLPQLKATIEKYDAHQEIQNSPLYYDLLASICKEIDKHKKDSDV